MRQKTVKTRSRVVFEFMGGLHARDSMAGATYAARGANHKIDGY